MPQQKLIDDVMAFICEHGIVAQGYVGFRREDAKQLIARIVEGPLPEEVGRIEFDPTKMGGFGWMRWEKLIEWCEQMSHPIESRAELFIALSGTKGEE